MQSDLLKATAKSSAKINYCTILNTYLSFFFFRYKNIGHVHQHNTSSLFYKTETNIKSSLLSLRLFLYKLIFSFNIFPKQRLEGSLIKLCWWTPPFTLYTLLYLQLIVLLFLSFIHLMTNNYFDLYIVL